MYPNNNYFGQGYMNYPYFNMNQSGQQGFQQGQQVMPPNKPQMPKTAFVASFDEVKSAAVDYDGSLNVFVDTQQDRIYTKQFTNERKVDSKVFILSKDEPREISPANFATKDDLEVLLSEVAELKDSLNRLEGGATK